MKQKLWLERSINQIYRLTSYEIINPGGRLVKSKSKSICRELPNDIKDLIRIRPHCYN